MGFSFMSSLVLLVDMFFGNDDSLTIVFIPVSIARLSLAGLLAAL